MNTTSQPSLITAEKARVICFEENKHQCWMKEAVEIRRRGLHTINKAKEAFMLFHPELRPGEPLGPVRSTPTSATLTKAEEQAIIWQGKNLEIYVKEGQKGSYTYLPPLVCCFKQTLSQGSTNRTGQLLLFDKKPKHSFSILVKWTFVMWYSVLIYLFFSWQR